jgi:hypothetical protein
VQLPAPHIDGIDARSTTLDQHLRESAGRRSHVETNAPFRVEAEMIERSSQFQAAARYIRMRRASVDLSGGVDFVAWFPNADAVRSHQPGGNRVLCLGTALEEAAVDEYTIGALLGHSQIRQARKMELVPRRTVSHAFAARRTGSNWENRMARKYSKSASKDVEREMHKFKRGKLKSGSGRKVKSRKQAIAIGLSEAREKGKKVPKKKSRKKSSSKRKSSKKKRL